MNKKQLNNFLSQCQQVSLPHSAHLLPENIQILRVLNTDQYIAMKSYPNDYYQSEQQLQQMIQTLKTQKQLCHDNLITIIDYYYGQEGLIVFTQHCSHNLLDQIQARKKQQNYFTLEEVQNILISISKALKYLEDHQIGHGCISPIDILISQKGSIKLIDPSLASNSPFDITHGYYYSPQLLKLNMLTMNALSKNSISNTQINFFTSDVFVLGVVLLHIGLLKDMGGCYNYYTATVSINQLRKNVIQFQQLYGPQMTQLLHEMLSVQESERITAQNILKFIQDQYDDSDQEDAMIEQSQQCFQENYQQRQEQIPYSYERMNQNQNLKKNNNMQKNNYQNKCKYEYEMNSKMSIQNNCFNSFNKQNYVQNPFPTRQRVLAVNNNNNKFNKNY